MQDIRHININSPLENFGIIHSELKIYLGPLLVVLNGQTNFSSDTSLL